ncbi:MAG TPA: hypothetical protein VGL17_04345 [Gemmatimonadaceae bacterium]
MRYVIHGVRTVGSSSLSGIKSDYRGWMFANIPSICVGIATNLHEID